MPQSKPFVAIVGRPNVGKSTLFNRLLGTRRAIVEDRPGTTRDRLYDEVEWNGRTFVLVDTGGLDLNPADEIAAKVHAQAELAIEEADVVLLVVDVTTGVAGSEYEIADLLRRSQKPVVLAVNKADNADRELGVAEFYALGLGAPYPIAANSGRGTGDLLDALVEALPPATAEEGIDEDVVHIAIVGRTNVGKSSLLNGLLGQERVIVSPQAGTTRDAIDTRLRYEDRELVLIDTAGIRRRGRVEPGVERYSVLRAMRAINRADVVLLMIDASQGVRAQDTHIAGHVLEAAKSVVVLVNKWDLVIKDTHTMAQYEQYVLDELKFMDYVPILFVSALTGQRVQRVLPLALEVWEEAGRRLTTAEINQILRDATARHSPPTKGGKKLRLYYGTQVGVRPPTIVIFVNDVRLVHFAYRRFLENRIRDYCAFRGSPLRLVFRGHADADRG
ncbi:MAG: ribosome biogenesis GTPase Der [Anaerolineae bacterium]